MRFYEFTGTHVKTPEHQRVDNLKASAKRAAKAAKLEQQRQRLAKAQQAIAKLRQAGAQD